MKAKSVQLSLITLFLIAAIPVNSAGQALKPTLTASVGIIRNLQTDPQFSRYSVYPEFQVSAPFVSTKDPSVILGGSIYSGAWFDGVNTITGGTDSNQTYSHSSVIVGGRIYVNFSKGSAPLTISGGLARHFIWADYVGGTSLGRPGADHRDTLDTAELGLRLQFPVTDNLRVGAETRMYFTLPNDEDDPHAYRAAYVITASYTKYE